MENPMLSADARLVEGTAGRTYSLTLELRLYLVYIAIKGCNSRQNQSQSRSGRQRKLQNQNLQLWDPTFVAPRELKTVIRATRAAKPCLGHQDAKRKTAFLAFGAKIVNSATLKSTPWADFGISG